MEMYRPMTKTQTLSELSQGVIARITGFATSDSELEAKLREVGFAEDDEVELLNRGPIGGTPLSIRLNRTVIALRRVEADAIHVASIG